MSGPEATGPPAWAEALVRAAAPRGLAGDGLLGDLEEEWHRLRRARGRGSANRWYVRTAAALAVRYGLERLRGRRDRPGRESGGADRDARTRNGHRDRHERFTNRTSTTRATMRTMTAMATTLGSDLRWSIRTLRKRPGFSLIVAVTLALAVGANAALFSVLNGVILSPIPYDDPGRIHMLFHANPSRGWSRWGMSLQDLQDFRESVPAFQALAGWSATGGNLAGDDEAERVIYAMTTPSLFSVFQVEAHLGRTFTEEDNRPGAPGVAILGHDLWQRTFGGDPDIVGSTVRLDGQSLTVVGVMPPDFDYPGGWTDVWRPFAMAPDDGGSRGARWVTVVGRLGEGVTQTAAQRQVQAVTASLAERFPVTHEGWEGSLMSFHEASVGAARRNVVTMWSAAVLVLLVACANVANLFLVRAGERLDELAVRRALGAGRARLARLVLTESVFLSLVGGAGGVGLAYWLTDVLRTAITDQLPRAANVEMDATVLAYSLGVTVLAGLFFGALPALRAVRADPAGELTSGSRGTLGPGRMGPGRTLIGVEVALATVLAVAGILLVRSFQELSDVPLGVDTDGRIAIRIAPSRANYPEQAEAVGLYRRLLERIEALPGVRDVGATNALPLQGGWWNTTVQREGHPDDVGPDAPNVNGWVATNGCFQAAGIPLQAGRTFDGGEEWSREGVLVVSRRAADHLWPGQDPLGKRLTFGGGPDPEDPPWFTVIGVVGDVRAQLDDPPLPVVYMPMAQAVQGFFRDWGMDIVVRAEADPGSLVGPVRRLVREADPGLPLARVRTLEQLARNNTARERIEVTLLGSFALLATFLAAIGVYGVVAYAVGRRTREIGLRMALGARRGSILGLTVSTGLTPALAGGATGLLAALAVSSVLRSFLYAVRPHDPVSLTVAGTTLALVAAAASGIPAWRASRLDPVEALRSD